MEESSCLDRSLGRTLMIPRAAYCFDYLSGGILIHIDKDIWATKLQRFWKYKISFSSYPTCDSKRVHSTLSITFRNTRRGWFVHSMSPRTTKDESSPTLDVYNITTLSYPHDQSKIVISASPTLAFAHNSIIGALT